VQASARIIVKAYSLSRLYGWWRSPAPPFLGALVNHGVIEDPSILEPSRTSDVQRRTHRTVFGSVYGIRTRVTAVRGRRPGPLDERAGLVGRGRYVSGRGQGRLTPGGRGHSARRRVAVAAERCLHGAHGELQDLAVGEVVHRRIVEMEAVGEALLVVGHKGEAVVAVLGAAELLHAR
jgi:hypothetical protein